MSSPFLGEFLGVLVFIAFGNSVVANSSLVKSKAFGAGWLNIILGWGIAVLMGVFVAIACGAPQADLNPAVTLAKLLAGIYAVSDAVIIMICQVIGGIVGGCIAWLFFRGHWELTDDKSVKLGVFCTIPAIRNYGQNFLCEVIGTFMLIFPIFAIFSRNVGSMSPGFGPFMVAVLVLGIGACMGGTTGYAINPARDLGPRLAHAICPIAGKGDSDWAYAWVPVVGPLLGAIIAFGIARIVGII